MFLLNYLNNWGSLGQFAGLKVQYQCPSMKFSQNRYNKFRQILAKQQRVSNSSLVYLLKPRSRPTARLLSLLITT